MSRFPPSRNDPSAPRFDGKPRSLMEFLEDVEELGDQYSIPRNKLMRSAIRYVQSEDYDLWRYVADSAADWISFKAAIINLYPGALPEEIYSFAKLNSLIRQQAKTPIINEEDFGKYYRSFICHITYLKLKSKLGDPEISKMLMKGLDPIFRSKVQTQLQLENPYHHSDDHWPLEIIYTAAILILDSPPSRIFKVRHQCHTRNPRSATTISSRRKPSHFLRAC